MKKVIIGLVAKHNKTDMKRPNTFIRDEMKDVLFYNNAIAIGIIPSCKDITLVNPDNERELYKDLDSLFSHKEKEDMIAQIELCDGIILQGGSASDVYEMWIAKYCYDNDIPLLAICAGQNNMVRAMGGTTKRAVNWEEHYQPDKEYVHSVVIDKESKFFNLVKTTKLKVNSRHRNCIDKPACLSVVAYDEDGNIEVVEDKSKTCFIGVRFHPESLYFIDKKHNKIFSQFIHICEQNFIENTQ